MSNLLTAPDGAAIGYIFNLEGHGAFDPNAKLANNPDPATIAAHNAELAARELAAVKHTGRGILYLTTSAKHCGVFVVSQWSGSPLAYASNIRRSWHNMAGKDGRTDVDFTFDGSRWHGINIGDNQILRVRRCKR